MTHTHGSAGMGSSGYGSGLAPRHQQDYVLGTKLLQNRSHVKYTEALATFHVYLCMDPQMLQPRDALVLFCPLCILLVKCLVLLQLSIQHLLVCLVRH